MNKPVLLEIKKPWRSIMDSIDNLRTCSYYLIANPDVIKSAQIPFCQKISKVKDIPVGLVCEDAYSNCAGFLLSQSKNLALPEALREEAENAFTTLNNQRLNCSNIPHAWGIFSFFFDLYLKIFINNLLSKKGGSYV